MRHWKIMAFVTLLCTVLTAQVAASDIEKSIDEKLTSLVIQEQSDSKLVALGAALSLHLEPAVITVTGERKAKSQVSVSRNDKWHLGSITKSITATMLARLVEKGMLQWNTKVGEVFKDEKYDPKWRDVTLHMLLTHTGGADTDFPWRIQSFHPAEGPERQKLRKQEVLNILADKPDYAPGTDFQYSNLGYTIAGIMAEEMTGKSWENLVREEVFQPVQLDSAGFGPPLDMNEELEQPRGHKDTWFSGPEAVAMQTDNSPIMGPAGSIHMSLTDLIAYANEHLKGSSGKSALLSKPTFDRLHKMGPHEYAYGWIDARDTTWSNGHSVLYHNGSNGYWYALLVLIPDLELSIAVTTNHGDVKAAQKSAWRIVRQTTRSILNGETD